MSLTKSTDLINHYVQTILSRSRYEHSLSTAKTAHKLAIYFGYPKPDLAYLAGLGHDVAKELSLKTQIHLAKMIGRYRYIDAGFPVILHGRVAAAILEYATGYYCQRVDAAFCAHTTGRLQMSALEKILYIADYIEPTRVYATQLEQNWKTFPSLTNFSYYVLSKSLTYLRMHNLAIHPDSLEWEKSLKEVVY
ncbi:MAG: bis(5'-nucleosyl)-tetraphosphatase (symmetrical) YqeK [Spirochaetia bacterium]